MEQNRAIHAFATLGHPGRLAVYRLLMRFAPRGVRPTEIAEALARAEVSLRVATPTPLELSPREATRRLVQATSEGERALLAPRHALFRSLYRRP